MAYLNNQWPKLIGFSNIPKAETLEDFEALLPYRIDRTALSR